MPRVRVKKRKLENGETMLMRNGFGNHVWFPPFAAVALLSKMLFFIPPISRGLNCYWREWKLLDNELHYIEWDIKELTDQILVKLSQRKEVQDRLKREDEEIKKNLAKGGRIGFKESMPYFYKVGIINFFCWGKEPELPPADPSWKDVLNPSLLKGQKKPSTVLGKALGVDHDLIFGNDKSVPHEETRAIVPEEYAMHLSKDFEEEGIKPEFWRTDDRKDSNSKSTGKYNQLKNKPKGMPNDEWKEVQDIFRDKGFID